MAKKKAVRLPSKPHRIYGLDALKLLDESRACSIGKKGFAEIFKGRKTVTINRPNIRRFASAVIRNNIYRDPSDIRYFLTSKEASEFDKLYEKRVVETCPAYNKGNSECTCEKRGWKFVERYICGPEKKKEK